MANATKEKVKNAYLLKLIVYVFNMQIIYSTK